MQRHKEHFVALPNDACSDREHFILKSFSVTAISAVYTYTTARVRCVLVANFGEIGTQIDGRRMCHTELCFEKDVVSKRHSDTL